MKEIKEKSELIKLQKENEELKRDLKLAKEHWRELRWKLLTQEERNMAILCFKMLVCENPEYSERKQFKQDLMDYKNKDMFKKTNDVFKVFE